MCRPGSNLSDATVAAGRPPFQHKTASDSAPQYQCLPTQVVFPVMLTVHAQPGVHVCKVQAPFSRPSHFTLTEQATHGFSIPTSPSYLSSINKNHHPLALSDIVHPNLTFPILSILHWNKLECLQPTGSDRHQPRIAVYLPTYLTRPSPRPSPTYLTPPADKWIH